jgi:hypothetical protein
VISGRLLDGRRGKDDGITEIAAADIYTVVKTFNPIDH